MGIPSTSSILLPFLKLLSDAEGHSIQNTREALLKYFELTQKEQDEMLPCGRLKIFDNNFGWARHYLRKFELIVSPSRGIFQITDSGAQVLQKQPNHLTIGDLRKFAGKFENKSIVKDSKKNRIKTLQPMTKFDYQLAIDGVAKKSSSPKWSVGRKVAAAAVRKLKPKIQLVTSEPTHQIVEVFFGTDRQIINAKKPGKRFTNSRSALNLGVCKVSIPSGHKIGEIEAPRWYRLELTENSGRHVLLLEATTMSEDFFRANLKLAFQKSTSGAFIFIHGFKVNFENAAKRTGQMAIDFGLKFVPAFYSWPSLEALDEYPAAGENSLLTQPHLEKFLSIFADESKAKDIFIIAHSMGARAVTGALESLHKTRPDLRHRFRELVLAAPDIDAKVFRNNILPYFRSVRQNVTLYSSSKDKALNLSKMLNGLQRAGETSPHPVVISGLETIDASDVKTDFLGHSYFAKSRILLTDMQLLMSNNLRAGDRPTLAEIQGAHGTYWTFKP
jgi:esterase/lipase superfamily enzyme